MGFYNDAVGPITWYFCISKILIDYGEQALHSRGCDYYLTLCMTFFFFTFMIILNMNNMHYVFPVRQ
jgi:hypothetical protein